MTSLTYAASIEEAILSGIALEDDKREQFNKIEQVYAALSNSIFRHNQII